MLDWAHALRWAPGSRAVHQALRSFLRASIPCASVICRASESETDRRGGSAIDLAFKKKAKPAPRLSQVETWQHDGQPWLALNHPMRERMTPLIDRSKVPARSLQGFPLILDHKGTLAARLEISNPPSTNAELQPAISDRSAA